MLLALLLGLLAADGISAFTGGQVQSPDGKWTVVAAAVNPDGEAMATEARLRGPGVDRPLWRFERHLDVHWRTEAQRVVLVEQTIHFERLGVFSLDRADMHDTLFAERQIAFSMLAVQPAIGEVENRRYTLRGFDAQGFCVTVAESGLPPGRSEGSFIEREAVFRVTYAGTATQVASCP